MRKLIEEMHISGGEKDAEIIRLKMHLGDEKARSRMRQTSQASLLNHSKVEPSSASKPTRLQDSRNESPMHRHPNPSNQTDFSEMQKSHSAEIKHLSDKLKDCQLRAKERAESQEQVISELKQDCYNMQEEV